MSNLIPGNQKHLTEDDRVFIEKCLDQSMPFKEIAKYLCKDPSTVSKEVRKHRIKHERTDFAFKNRCAKRAACNLRDICGRPYPCKKKCSNCASCNSRCGQFEEDSCKAVLKAPYVCNGCPKKTSCRKEKRFYRAVTANRQYRHTLSDSRRGINISEAGLDALDGLVTPLILQGQTPYQILNGHPEINLSAKTLYNYIEAGALSVKNLDLPRKVRYKQRKTRGQQTRDMAVYEGRSYKDYQAVMAEYPDTNVVEMDTVHGCEGSRKALLTFYFRSCKLMLVYLLPDRKAESVRKVFDRLEGRLSTLGFCRAFPLILTDRGMEFSDPEALENGKGGFVRTSIYYCDPMASWQKAEIEKNHEYLRYVLPKGASFDGLMQWEATKIANHVNSTPRASLNGLTPFGLAQALLGPEAIRAFSLREIPPDEVNLKPALVK
jgi:IS30 family transposase